MGLDIQGAMNPAPLAHDRIVSDPDVLAQAIPGTRLLPCQLDPVPIPSRLSRYQLSEACLDLALVGPRMTFAGETALDSYTLVFVTQCPEPGQSFNFGVEHGAGYLGVFSPGAVIDAMTPPGYGNAMLTIQRQAFLDKLERLYPEAPNRVLKAGAPLRPTARVAQAFYSSLSLATESIHSLDPERPEDFTARFEAAILHQFLQVFIDGCEQSQPTGALRLHKRHQRLRQAREFIEAHLHLHLPLESVCQASGLSQRGLEQLFQDLLDVTPIAYLRQRRLQRARQKLQQVAPQPGLVKKVAFECGFTHLGRFAHDYRRQFGESPGVTLSRS